MVLYFFFFTFPLGKKKRVYVRYNDRAIFQCRIRKLLRPWYDWGHFNRIIPLHIQHVEEIKYFITTLSFFSLVLGSTRRHFYHLKKKTAMILNESRHQYGKGITPQSCHRGRTPAVGEVTVTSAPKPQLQQGCPFAAAFQVGIFNCTNPRAAQRTKIII